MNAELCDNLLVTTSLFISPFPYFQLLGSEYVVLGTATTLQTAKKKTNKLAFQLKLSILFAMIWNKMVPEML
jgi:hypothetical protein